MCNKYYKVNYFVPLKKADLRGKWETGDSGEWRVINPCWNWSWNTKIPQTTIL